MDDHGSFGVQAPKESYGDEGSVWRVYWRLFY